MGTSTTRALDSTEITQTQNNIAIMAGLGAGSSAGSGFRYVASFDGTNNSRSDLGKSGSKLQTNIANIAAQVEQNINPSLGGKYFEGVGTGGANGNIANAAILPTDPINYAADTAYKEFKKAAQEYFDNNPTATAADFSASAIGYSRGTAAAVRFAQLLNEQPIVLANPNGGQLIINNVPIYGLALLEPVHTGIDFDSRIPSNVKGNVLVVQALDEFRTAFKAVDYSLDARVTTIKWFGNHGDTGGNNDANGLGAGVWEGTTRYLQNMGAKIADIPVSAKINLNASIPMHTENYQTAMNGNVLYTEADPITGAPGVPKLNWGIDGSRGARLTTQVGLPKDGAMLNALVDAFSNPQIPLDSPGIQIAMAGDGTKTTTYGGELTVISNDATGLLKASFPDASAPTGTSTLIREGAAANSGEGVYTVSVTQTNAAGQVQSETMGRQVATDSEVVNSSTYTRKPDGTYKAELVIGGQTITLGAKATNNGDYAITGIGSVNGKGTMGGLYDAMVLDQLLNDPISANYLLDPKGRAKLAQLVEVVDPASTTDGMQVITGTYEIPWYKDETLIARLNDISSLVAAFRSGKPLPIARAVFGAASHYTNNQAINEIGKGLSVISNINGLNDAFNRGDLVQVALNSGGLATTYLQMQQTVLRDQLGKVALDSPLFTQTRDELISTTSALENLGKGLALLNLAIAIDKGDVNGAIISAAYFIPVYGPMISAILSIADMVLGPLTSGNKNFNSDGKFVRTPSNDISIALGDHNGGAQVAWTAIMTQLLTNAKDMATAQSTLTKVPMGVILERLPRVSLNRGVAMLWYTDAKTGQEFSRTFDLNSNLDYLAPGYIEDIDEASPWGANPVNKFAAQGRNVNPEDRTTNNQVALSAHFFENLFEQARDLMALSGAIAPQWEVDTVNEQARLHALYTPEESMNTGLNTLEVARMNGNLFGIPDSNPFAPIVLDLDHNGKIATTDRYYGPGVLFDVDGDGFAEETNWIGPRDGILVLDRNADGRIDMGTDLFNDRGVDNEKRGLQVLREIDKDSGATYSYNDSHLDASDPVFSQLRVWLDINQDGVAQDLELKTLASLGITSNRSVKARKNCYGKRSCSRSNYEALSRICHKFSGGSSTTQWVPGRSAVKACSMSGRANSGWGLADWAITRKTVCALRSSRFNLNPHFSNLSNSNSPPRKLP